jgi:predicted DNA repair protein MutK
MLVRGMPALLGLLGALGTAAMIWVGGGIIMHGLAAYGWDGIETAIHGAALAAAQALPQAGGLVEWIVTAAGSGLVGLLVGAAAIPLVGWGLAPVWRHLKRLLRRVRRS